MLMCGELDVISLYIVNEVGTTEESLLEDFLRGVISSALWEFRFLLQVDFGDDFLNSIIWSRTGGGMERFLEGGGAILFPFEFRDGLKKLIRNVSIGFLKAQ